MKSVPLLFSFSFSKFHTIHLDILSSGFSKLGYIFFMPDARYGSKQK